MKNMKRYFSLVIATFFIITNLFYFNIHAQTTLTTLANYDDIRDKNVVDCNFDNIDLSTLSFDKETIFPDSIQDNINKLLEYGQDPGLNIRKLQSEGFNGNNVSVAIIDQPLLLTHEEINNSKLHYFKLNDDRGMNNPSMHGNTVLDILAGKNGIAKESDVYYIAYPSWEGDQTNEANSFKKIIEINKTLSDNKKIKIVSISHGYDTRNKNSDKYKEAKKELEDTGVIVIDTNTFKEVLLIGTKNFEDRNDYNNYTTPYVINLDSNLTIPSNNITEACGYTNNNNDYIYWGVGGTSWTVPYIVGVMTLGLQINPNLSENDIINYIIKSEYPKNKNGISNIINPEGFINLVKQECSNPIPPSIKKQDKVIALYNKNKVTNDDINAINNFAREKNYELIDTSNYNSAQQIYDMLKEKSNSVNIKGIQIFGIDSDVNAFNINYKVLTNGSIDGVGANGDIIKSDYFYSNFNNDSNKLTNFNVYDDFQNKLNIDLSPQWPVVRLLVTTGEFSKFFDKYNDYTQQNKFMPIVNFSNPIFASNYHNDDMGIFLNRLNTDFNILNNNQYKLYGNLQGKYPVSTKVLGDYTKENVQKENQNGICQYIINSHGQFDNIDGITYDNNNNSTRHSLINMNNINDVLNKNYYQMDLWTCLPGYEMNTNNIIHKILAEGKCVNALGNTYNLFNNGVNNSVNLNDLQKNNFFDFYYWLIKGMYQDNLSKSQAFSLAQQHYYSDIMNNTDNISDHNYQYNLYNLLCYSNFGVLDNNNIINNGLYNYNNEILNKKNGDTININFNNNVKDCDIKIENSNGDIFTPKYDINNNKISVKLDNFDNGEYTLFINDAKNKNNSSITKKYQCNFLVK